MSTVQSFDSLLHADGTIDSKLVRFTFDCGSTRSFIATKIAKSLELDWFITTGSSLHPREKMLLFPSGRKILLDAKVERINGSGSIVFPTNDKCSALQDCENEDLQNEQSKLDNSDINTNYSNGLIGDFRKCYSISQQDNHKTLLQTGRNIITLNDENLKIEEICTKN